jgi:signal transduction histidine kinase
MVIADNFNLKSILKTSQTLSQELSTDELLKKIMNIIIENSGSQTGYLFFEEDSKLKLLAGFKDNSFTNNIKDSQLPINLIHYVKRTQKDIVFSADNTQDLISTDKYILNNNPKSMFCTNIFYKEHFRGILYIENRDILNLYSKDKIEILKLLINQASTSMENAKLFGEITSLNTTLEQKVLQRTKEFETQKEKAQQATKTKSEFLANMSHEIRTPMNAVLGFTELLIDTDTSTKQDSYIKSIQSGAKGLLTIINDILDISKIEAGKLHLEYESTNIKEELQDLSQIFYQQIDTKGLEFTLEIEETLEKTLILDAVRIRQILFNLIGNAIKFTEKGFIKVKINSFENDLNNTVDLIISITDS